MERIFQQLFYDLCSIRAFSIYGMYNKSISMRSHKRKGTVVIHFDDQLFKDERSRTTRPDKHRMQSSATTSRGPSPSRRTATPVWIRLANVQPAWFSRPICMIILGVLTFISALMVIGSYRFSNYCTQDDPEERWCSACPKLANCSKSDFTCANGTIKNKEQCLLTSLNEKSLRYVHEEVKNALETGKIGHRDDLPIFKWSGNYSIEDLEAAVLYDNELFFADNGEILFKPRPLDPTSWQLIFDLFAICFAASIEAYLYRKYYG
jgi:hypothetical protein